MYATRSYPRTQRTKAPATETAVSGHSPPPHRAAPDPATLPHVPPTTCYAALPIAWHPPEWRGHFPQLSLEDRLIWHRFLDHWATAYDCYAYDVAIGGLDCDDPHTPPALARAWRYCTAKRIDVLALRDGRPTIIEVRYQAGVSAVGALLVYRVLFREHNRGLPRAPLRLITDNIAPDTQRAAEHYGIEVTVLPA